MREVAVVEYHSDEEIWVYLPGKSAEDVHGKVNRNCDACARMTAFEFAEFTKLLHDESRWVMLHEMGSVGVPTGILRNKKTGRFMPSKEVSHEGGD